MEVLKCTKSDFDQILTEFNDFWGSDRTLHLHHPMLIYEFGNSAFVIKEADKVTAYLFGFLAQTGPVGYVHLIAVRQTHRKCGYGRRLYAHFAEFARKHGCKTLKAITSASNTTSIAFHKSIGMEPIGDSNGDDISIIRDYSGPGADRVVLQMKL
ncbi:MAG: GNAT family N-acetyltransferase [Chloroflexota bacterium]|nr:MAG: GNAT family N-acetyltransferase [Chloroflexota bacterium]